MAKKIILTIYMIFFVSFAGYTRIPEINDFFKAAGKDEIEAEQSLNNITLHWKNSYSAMILDLARFMSPVIASKPTSGIRKRLIRFLTKATGEKFGDDLGKWRKWLWKQVYEPHPDLIYFKAKLYTVVDKRMGEFFRPGTESSIRLDEIDWGGVKVNGIPPLYFPEMIPAKEAGYINKNNIVFGIYHNGEARAYPKKILAWHEMALDTFGGTDITLVYCTLCGSAIPYISRVEGRKEKFGTSGLLFRSNKLMFDFRTKSLWSALSGEPVVGPLINRGIRLEELPMVVTTWEEWRKVHPDTKVLAPVTGFKRDYREGQAYRDYFSTDKLMFPVPEQKKILNNKETVLSFRIRTNEIEIPVAASIKFLKKKKIFHTKIINKRIVILTTKKGAARVYGSDNYIFVKLKTDRLLIDDRNREWIISEDHLEFIGSPGIKLERIPAHNSFWFGWKAQFPETILLK